MIKSALYRSAMFLVSPVALLSRQLFCTAIFTASTFDVPNVENRRNHFIIDEIKRILGQEAVPSVGHSSLSSDKNQKLRLSKPRLASVTEGALILRRYAMKFSHQYDFG